MNLTRKHKQIQILKTNIFTKEKRGWEAINQDFGINTYKLVYIKQIKKKQNMENYIQYPVINHNGKEYDKQNHFAVWQKLTNCKSTILQ